VKPDPVVSVIAVLMLVSAGVGVGLSRANDLDIVELVSIGLGVVIACTAITLFYALLSVLQRRAGGHSRDTNFPSGGAATGG
jgi:hypothetical protein